jgi:hypothetical protein
MGQSHIYLSRNGNLLKFFIGNKKEIYDIFIGTKNLFTHILIQPQILFKLIISFKKSSTMWFDTNKYNTNELYSSLIYKINTRYIFLLIYEYNYLFIFSH